MEDKNYSFSWRDDEKKQVGTYRIQRSSLCLTPEGDSKEYCRTRRFLAGKPVWFHEETSTYNSEITEIIRFRALIQKEKKSTPLIARSRPKACENVSNFCTQLSLKAAACGWVAHEGANRALDTDTGSAGSAIAGASCTALMSTAEGLEIDIIDLAISATSSAIMSEAEESFRKGEFSSGFVQGLVGAGVGVVGAAKCQATLEQACR